MHHPVDFTGCDWSRYMAKNILMIIWMLIAPCVPAAMLWLAFTL
jgi:hypothetical protein